MKISNYSTLFSAQQASQPPQDDVTMEHQRFLQSLWTSRTVASVPGGICVSSAIESLGSWEFVEQNVKVNVC